ncbi:MAG TPA: DUF4288 domain-containing protein [Chitinophagaceae bacterium]|nr:DUF4288 domain-containing protein [Chitinophagaceae bacterium]
MKKILDLDEWRLDENTLETKRTAVVSVHLKYIDLKKVIHLTPKERTIAIDKHLKDSFSKLLNTKLFDTYKLIGTTKKPRGVETKIHLTEIEKLASYSFVEYIFINSIRGAKRIIKATSSSFFCIKMTVAIQIEGIKRGLQTYEERYVLIKAKSSEDAYNKIERRTKQYEKPYLNSQGQLVRWKVESLDDCYATDIINFENLNDPEGAEVFSVLKRRKLTSKRFWNGKLN